MQLNSELQAFGGDDGAAKPPARRTAAVKVAIAGLRVLQSGDRASGSPSRRSNDGTLGFLLREAVKLARGRNDATLMWLLHKAVERVKGGGDE